MRSFVFFEKRAPKKKAKNIKKMKPATVPHGTVPRKHAKQLAALRKQSSNGRINVRRKNAKKRRVVKKTSEVKYQLTYRKKFRGYDNKLCYTVFTAKSERSAVAKYPAILRRFRKEEGMDRYAPSIYFVSLAKLIKDRRSR